MRIRIVTSNTQKLNIPHISQGWRLIFLDLFFFSLLSTPTPFFWIIFFFSLEGAERSVDKTSKKSASGRISCPRLRIISVLDLSCSRSDVEHKLSQSTCPDIDRERIVWNRLGIQSFGICDFERFLIAQ